MKLFKITNVTNKKTVIINIDNVSSFEINIIRDKELEADFIEVEIRMNNRSIYFDNHLYSEVDEIPYIEDAI